MRKAPAELHKALAAPTGDVWTIIVTLGQELAALEERVSTSYIRMKANEARMRLLGEADRLLEANSQKSTGDNLEAAVRILGEPARLRHAKLERRRNIARARYDAALRHYEVQS